MAPLSFRNATSMMVRHRPTVMRELVRDLASKRDERIA